MKSNFHRANQVVMLIIAMAAFVALATATDKSRASKVTFTKDVAPILYKSCAECH